MRYAVLRNKHDDYIYISILRHGYAHLEDKPITDYAKYQRNFITYEKAEIEGYIEVMIQFFNYHLVEDNLCLHKKQTNILIFNPIHRYAK